MQKTLQDFFNERTVEDFFEKLNEVAPLCKHVKHVDKLMKELKDFNGIITGFSQGKTFDARVQVENNPNFLKNLNNLKDKAMATSFLAMDYSTNSTHKKEKVQFKGLSIFLEKFAKLSTDDFLIQKEELMTLLGAAQMQTA